MKLVLRAKFTKNVTHGAQLHLSISEVVVQSEHEQNFVSAGGTAPKALSV